MADTQADIREGEIQADISHNYSYSLRTDRGGLTLVKVKVMP